MTVAQASAATTTGGRRLPVQIVRFATVGAGSTVLHLGLFALLQERLGQQAGNLAALALATLANTAVNRRWTFDVTGPTGAARQHVQAFVVFGIAWFASAAALSLTSAVAPHPSTMASTSAVAASMVLSTALRFVLMRRWIFRSPTPSRASVFPRAQ